VCVIVDRNRYQSQGEVEKLKRVELIREKWEACEVDVHDKRGICGVLDGMEVLAECGSGTRLVRLGVRDTFGESGTAEELLAKHGLDADGIVKSVAEVMKKQ
jgi:deoxyxylulose-5-phosphate synthase